jgi:hypothetical protein
MSQMQRDPDAYYLMAGKQMGRELAAVDVYEQRPRRDPEKLVPIGVHPNYGKGLVEGYHDAWTALDPIAVAMGGN